MGVCSLPETAAACGLHGCLAQEETPRRCRRDRRAPARSGLRARVLPPRQPSGVWGAGSCRHSRAHEKTGPWAAARRAGTLDECPTCLSSSGDAGSWAWRPSPRAELQGRATPGPAPVRPPCPRELQGPAGARPSAC